MGQPDRQRRRARRARPWLAPLVLGVAVVALIGVARATGAFDTPQPAGNTAGTTATAGTDPRIVLVVGKTAPDFSLPDVNGTTFRLADAQKSSNVLLFFQEGLGCPPCFQEMRDIRREEARLGELNVKLVSIAPNPLGQLKEGARQENVLGMPLLSDETLSVSRQYGTVFVSMHPEQTPGHAFVLLDQSGKVLWRQDAVEMYVPVPQLLDDVAKALGK